MKKVLLSIFGVMALLSFTGLPTLAATAIWSLIISMQASGAAPW